MRLLYWLPAAVLALASCAAEDVPSDPIGDEPDDEISEPVGEGVGVDADVFKSLNLFNPPGGNSTSPATVVEDMLLALSSTSASTVACNGGKASTHVLVGMSGCFSKNQMNAILDKIASSVVTDEGNKFYKDGAEISRKFYWAWYADGTCSPAYTGVGNTNIAPAETSDTTFYTYVNVAKGKGISVADALGKIYGKTFESSLGLRVCSDCTSDTQDRLLTNVGKISSAKMDIIAAMHCGALPSSVPKHDKISNVKQCKCECKGPLALGADGTCGPCKGGRVYSEADSACVCPEGTTLSGDACVPVCVWKGSKVCSWSSADKTDLKLLADCGVLAPVAKDNYVADRRVNQNDPSGNTDPTTRPLITITAQEGTSPAIKATSTWYNYVESPGVLENKVALDSFGIFNLKMDASDYRKDATCDGCVAVVDDYRPTPDVGCDTSDESQNTCEFSQTKLTDIIAAEAKFTGFYDPTNVKNNNAGGDNERDDLRKRSITDFFATSAADSCALDVPCFSDDFAVDLVVSAKTTPLDSLATLVAAPPEGGLVCKRCCSKQIVLREKVKNYNCDGNPVSSTTKGTAECKFGRCLQMGADTLIKAEAVVTVASQTKTQAVVDGLPPGSNVIPSATTMRRSVPCTTIGGEGCTVKETLGDMLEKSTNWQQAFASKLAGHSAAEIVYWRYKLEGNDEFATWADADELTFVKESTGITVQAWSRCGLVLETIFTVVLHPHTDCDACLGFSAGWTDKSPDPRTADGNICAYPGSDFALLGFKSDSDSIFTEAADKHKCSMTNVVCTLAVAAEGASGSAATTQLLTATPTGGRVLIDKKLAIELVKEAKTAKNTDVAIECLFSYQYYGSTDTKTKKCPTTLYLTDCDGSTLQTYTSDLTCLDSKCGSPFGAPGAYETCDGDVFTTAEVDSVVTTEKKAVSGACCTECSQTLSCTALPEASDIKRCEPPSPPTSLLALVTESIDELAAAAPAEQSSLVTMLLGASAMVAVMALVVAKARAAKTKSQPVDDAYVSLLD